MKFRAIFRFEFNQQVRRVPAWLFFSFLGILAFLQVRLNFIDDALYDDFFVNSPFVIALVSVFIGLVWMLVSASIAGEAASRDIQTRMHPLVFTAPISKAEYLGGRFLAAFLLNTIVLLAIPIGIMLAVYLPGVTAGIVGPFRPVAYLGAFAFITLPNAFFVTAIQFSLATLNRKAKAAYFGSLLLFFTSYAVSLFIGVALSQRYLAKLTDNVGIITIVMDLALNWTPAEKGVRLLELKGPLLANRLVWIGVGTATFLLTLWRFQFNHYVATRWWKRRSRKLPVQVPTPGRIAIGTGAITIPQASHTFDLLTRLRQTLAIAGISFRQIARSRGGLLLFGFFSFLLFVFVPENMYDMGTPLMPRTEYMLTFITTPLTRALTPWIIIPLLIIIHAGELMWREREAGLGEITDAAPVPEWAPFLGKYLGLSCIIVTWLAMLMATGILIQVRMEYYHFEIGLYLKALFGLQLPNYLLFALLAFVVHALINQKYLAHLMLLVTFAYIIFASSLGIENQLLVFGSDPGWSYTDMRGFGSSIGPWAWFKLYWAAWALLLAILARLMWVRGKETGLAARLQLARRRFTHSTGWIAGTAVALLLGAGGYIYYNTNILVVRDTTDDTMKRRAGYEQHYKRFERIPQPRISDTRLHVEIYPTKHKAVIHGTYLLVNKSEKAIDSIHVATMPGIITKAIAIDRPTTSILTDDLRACRTYCLQQPLQPGDSLHLGFDVYSESHGFTSNGIMANGTYFSSNEWLPAIGYQVNRELIKPGERRKYGLPARPLVPSLYDTEERKNINGEGGTLFEAVVGTDIDQVAVAPGALKETWTKDGRRYFRYATDATVGDENAFFSANYALRKAQWKDTSGSGKVVDICIYYHPAHSANLDRIERSIRATLGYNTKHFGPYPFGYITFVERGGSAQNLHAEPSLVSYGEPISRFDPKRVDGGVDLPFAATSHEISHQWWGGQLPYARVEGAGLLSESLAWFSAMGVVKEIYGNEHLQQLREFFRQPEPIPPIRQSVPLLRGMDPYAIYRKGPYALYALSEYMGVDRVNTALRRLFEKYRSGVPNLATTLDLYHELQAVTPDSLQYLLHDLFEADTEWELKTKRANMVQTKEGAWEVTLDVHARKIVIDSAGNETEAPVNEWIEVGAFVVNYGEPRKTLYLQKHRITSGEHSITITVKDKPNFAGIDPNYLLIDLDPNDNARVIRENTGQDRVFNDND